MELEENGYQVFISQSFVFIALLNFFFLPILLFSCIIKGDLIRDYLTFPSVVSFNFFSFQANNNILETEE